MSKFRCIVCDYIYDEAEGDPSQNVLPGTTWAQLPEEWVCPLCGVGKDQFEKIIIDILLTDKSGGFWVIETGLLTKGLQ